jgi:hypothetical protein
MQSILDCGSRGMSAGFAHGGLAESLSWLMVSFCGPCRSPKRNRRALAPEAARSWMGLRSRV